MVFLDKYIETFFPNSEKLPKFISVIFPTEFLGGIAITIFVLALVFLFFLKKGYLHFTTKTIVDVERELRRSEERNRKIIEILPIGIVIHNKEKFVYLNSSALRILGAKNMDKIKDKSIYSFVHPDYLEDAKDRINKLYSKNVFAMPAIDEKFIRLDGSLIDVSVTGIQFTFMGQLCALLLIDDVSIEKRNKELLREKENKLIFQNEELNRNYKQIQKMNLDLTLAKNKAEESDQLKSAFLANMSHEIRTPMNGILGFTELICRDDVTLEKRLMYSNIINSSANQLLAILTDILDLSLIEAGQALYSTDTISLNLLVAEIEKLFRDKIIAKNLKFRIINKITESDFQFVGDSHKIKQVFINILNNALKFTQLGFIEIEIGKQNNELQFVVSDSGTGVLPEYKEIIFDRFRQAEFSISKRFGGTGLGLTIAKAYVEMADGKIWVESDGIQGSKFFFTIPYFLPKTKIDILQIRGEKKHWELDNYTMLIVEDEIDVATMIREVLEDTHLKILYAANGRIAIEMVKEHPEINLILMDIKMPEVNGIEATIEIRKINENIPIVAQTAYTLSNELEMIKKAGCNDIITKPLDIQELMETVAKYIL